MYGRRPVNSLSPLVTATMCSEIFFVLDMSRGSFRGEA
jgi:hypothetical protein